MVLCSAAVDVDAGDGRLGEPEKRASPWISSSQREAITAGQERAGEHPGDGGHHHDETTPTPRPLYLLRKTTSPCFPSLSRSDVAGSPARAIVWYPASRHGVQGPWPAGRCRLTTPTDSGRIASDGRRRYPRRAKPGKKPAGTENGSYVSYDPGALNRLRIVNISPLPRRSVPCVSVRPPDVTCQTRTPAAAGADATAIAARVAELGGRSPPTMPGAGSPCSPC